MACVLLACDDYYKENGQPRLNTVWVSSMAMTDAFKNSSDSLTRLWEVSRWWISEFFIPYTTTLYTAVIDHIGSLVRTGNEDISLTFDNSSPINNLIAQGLVSNDDICVQKLSVKQYSFRGCKMNFISMIDEFLDMNLLENIAKDLKTAVEKVRNLMSELFPLIDLIAKFEMDTTDDSGKDACLKAKEFVREWSKFDSDFDIVISGALAVVDRRFHQKSNFSESEYSALDVGVYIVKINHRKILGGNFQICGVPDSSIRPISFAVDKLDKLPWEDVKKEMTEQ